MGAFEGFQSILESSLEAARRAMPGSHLRATGVRSAEWLSRQESGRREEGSVRRTGLPLGLGDEEDVKSEGGDRSSAQGLPLQGLGGEKQLHV